MLDSVFAWATGNRRTPRSYSPDQVKVAFRRHLGRGWYGVEEDTSGVRVWSRNIAEIRITPDVTRVTLGFTTHYHEWTGSPQVVTFAKDGSHYLTLRVTRECAVVTIKCKGNHLISIRPATVKPSEFEKTSDSRAVGICLDHLVVEPRQIPAMAEEPEKLLCTRELNPTGMPHTLQVEITSACNLRCRMCVNHAPTNPKLWRIGAHMNEVLWEKVRLLLPQADVLVFMGDGEVFTHPKFLEYLEEADRFGVRTVFHTNGQLLRGEVIDRLAALRHLFRMTVSIDSPDPELYQRIRGGPLAPVMQGLRELGRRSALADRICVMAVVMKSALRSLQEFPAQLTDLGLKHLVFRGLIDYDFTLAEECPAYDEDDVAVLRSIKRECDTRGIHLTLLPPIPAGLVEVSHDDDLHQDLRVETPQGWGELSGPETKQCFDPWEKVVITRDGSVYPCDVYGLSSGALGNLTTQSFEEVWRGNPFTNFRRDLLQGYRSGCLNCVRRQTGPHPLLHCAARIHNERCWSSEHQANLSVENIGTFTWTKNTQLHVGTSARRDRTDSTYYHPGWLSPNRVSTFLEEQVAPGQIATFRFPIASRRPSVPERFQLVFEHQFWLPNTVFQLPFPKAG